VLEPLLKKIRKEDFFEEMNKVVPLQTFVALNGSHARGAHQALGGRPPFAAETMLRTQCFRLWWNLSDLAMEKKLHERPLSRRFVGLDGLYESTVLRFRHLLEKHQLAPQVLATINAELAPRGLVLKTATLVDATIIAAPSSTESSSVKRDSEIHQTMTGNQWRSGMKANIGVDDHSGLVHSALATATTVNDVMQAGALAHCEEPNVFADADYQGVTKREETSGIEGYASGQTQDTRQEHTHGRDHGQAVAAQDANSIRAKAEHPLRVIKQQLGHPRMRYRDLAKTRRASRCCLQCARGAGCAVRS
jgi:IS5 family transposase